MNKKKIASAQHIEIARKIGQSFKFEKKHANQVYKLSILLFDQLKPLHELDDNNKKYLEVAALLHDSGNYYGLTRHNRHSYKIIRDSDFSCFSKTEKKIIALIARYHRQPMNAEPVNNSFIKLNRKNMIIVLKLSSLLRIADGLDYSHSNTVKNIQCSITASNVHIQCSPDSEFFSEKKQVLKKSDLFNYIFKKSISLGT